MGSTVLEEVSRELDWQRDCHLEMMLSDSLLSCRIFLTIAHSLLKRTLAVTSKNTCIVIRIVDVVVPPAILGLGRNYPMTRMMKSDDELGMVSPFAHFANGGIIQ